MPFFSSQTSSKVRDLDGKMENLSLEVKDFEGAVKLQGAMMEKVSAQRKSDPEEKGKEKKMTETQRAMLGSHRECQHCFFLKQFQQFVFKTLNQ